MQDDWNIKPKHGIGPLVFNMTESQVVSLGTPIYGDVESAGALGQQSNDEVYQILLEALGEEAARVAMEELDKANVDIKPSRRVIFRFGIIADFEEDRLVSLMGFNVAKKLNFEGHRFFDVSPIDALVALQNANGQFPLMKESDCYFQSLEVTAFDVIVREADGTFRINLDGSDEAEQKTISWRNSPRNPSEILTGHVAVDLLKQSL